MKLGVLPKAVEASPSVRIHVIDFDPLVVARLSTLVGEFNKTWQKISFLPFKKRAEN